MKEEQGSIEKEVRFEKNSEEDLEVVDETIVVDKIVSLIGSRIGIDNMSC